MLRFALLLLLCAPAVLGAQSLADRLDAYLRPYAEADYLSGTVLVARGDSVLYERSFGWADRELQVPFTPGTRSNIASITKPMTIVIMTRMYDAGLIRPDQTLDTWIPEYPRADQITVSHLLNHRAGVPHRVTTPEQQTVPRSAADMVRFAMQAEQLPHAPGEVSVYSSGGYSVLARVLELAGGADYATLLRRYLTEPVGMSDTWHGSARDILPGRAEAYGWSAHGLANAPLEDLSYLVGAGSVYSTSRDLFRMMRALLAGRLGATAQGALEREGGLSWNGSTSGFRAWADWDRGTDVTVILAANLPSGANDMIRRDIPRIVAGERVVAAPPPPVSAATVSMERLSRYDGNYEFRPGSPMLVAAEDGGLRVGSWFLIPLSDTTFFSPQDFGTVTARFGPNGAVTHFDWESNGGTTQMRRVGGT